MRLSIVVVALISVSGTIHGQVRVLKESTGSQNCAFILANMSGTQQYAPCEVMVFSDHDTQKLIADAQQAAQQAAQQTAQSNLDAVNKSLNDKISNLQQSIKALSDANDALTKRLNDLEQKVNKQNQTSGVERVLPKAEAHNARSHDCARPGQLKRTGAGRTTLRISVNEGSHPRCVTMLFSVLK
jgi:septal ring factor EnvC (AmiA/AmiB activator)